MSTVLLDTTVASLLHPKKKRSTLRAKYEPHMQGQILAVSFQSVAELWSWAEENKWGSKQRDGLTIFLQRSLSFPTTRHLPRSGPNWARTVRESGAVWKLVTFGLLLPLFGFEYRCSRMTAITQA
jgi:tRNA(fMet)-specific endonuclease VapC